MEDFKYDINFLNDNRIRVIIYTNNTVEIGVMYYEKSKIGFINKPIMNGWTCVDAKVDELYRVLEYKIEPIQVLNFIKQKVSNFVNKYNDENK